LSGSAQIVRFNARADGDDVALAEALGLRRVPWDGRKAVPPEIMRPLIAAARDRVIASESANLDRAIVDPKVALGSVPFTSLFGRRDIIVPRLDPMLTAIEQGIAFGGLAKANAQNMFHLLETIAADIPAPIMSRIEAIRTRDDRFGFKVSRPPDDGRMQEHEPKHGAERGGSQVHDA
jgi:hypothetical protein